MQKICKKCNTQFEITDSDQNFYNQINVPAPNNCPDCRFQRRLQERNARKLYRRKCSFSGETIISQYHEDHPFPVYKNEIWWSDKWDGLSYGQNFDFNKSFFEQYKELLFKVPHISLYQIAGTMDNSEYTNCTGYLKNCYLVFETDHNEDLYYSNRITNSKNLMDCSYCDKCESCFECIDCNNCYNLKYSQYCENCSDSAFLYECKSCSNCIACINQRHKEYMAFNKQYSKEEFEKIKESYDFAKLKKEAFEFFINEPHKNLQQEHNENSLGNHLYFSKNSTYCFDSKDLEDCKYCAKVSLKAKNCMDYNSWGDKAELMYECSACGDNAYNLKFCSTCTTNNSNLEYCTQCTGSKDLFGCVGLRKKQYCIFNKQYTKEEYEKLRKEIIEYMIKTKKYGEYFPQNLCTYGYNETIAMEYFPLTKEEAEKKGFIWTEKEQTYKPQTYVVPQKIEDVPASIVQEVLACKKCTKNFKIIPQELKFYKQMNLPIPENCYDCRHFERMGKRTSWHFYSKKCDKCGKDIQTTFSQERPEKVYCEECYLKEII